MKITRKALIILAITSLILEIASLVITKNFLNLLFKKNLLISYVKCEINKNQPSCLPERFNRYLGWNTLSENPYGDGIRESEDETNLTKYCGAAFGDSFTYSNDVEQNKAWTRILGDKIGCGIKNYGVGGYSYIQAFNKFVLYKPSEKLIIFTVYEKMLKRSLASSNLTPGLSSEAKIYIRPYLNKSYMISNIALPVKEKTDYFQNHMRDDWYIFPKISFPFSYNLLKRKINDFNVANDGITRFYFDNINAWGSERKTDFFNIFIKWFGNYSYAFENRDVLLVFLPSPSNLDRWETIEKRINQINLPKNICVSNPARKMIDLNKENSDILGKTKHLNEYGESLLAESIKSSLESCFPKYLN